MINQPIKPVPVMSRYTCDCHLLNIDRNDPAYRGATPDEELDTLEFVANLPADDTCPATYLFRTEVSIR